MIKLLLIITLLNLNVSYFVFFVKFLLSNPLKKIKARKKAPARCWCLKSVKFFMRFKLIWTNLNQKNFVNV